MFDGKMLRELAGIPIRRIDFAKSALALAEPDPLTLANLTTKSLTLVIGDGIRSELVRVFCHPPRRRGSKGRECWPPCGPRPRPALTGRSGDGEAMTAVIGCGMRVRPLSCREGICACPTRRSGSARRTGRNAGRRLRL